jgi:hypothetical protein
METKRRGGFHTKSSQVKSSQYEVWLKVIIENEQKYKSHHFRTTPGTYMMKFSLLPDLELLIYKV